MWMPYITVIKDKAPNAVLVFDKFHIVRHLMDAVDQVRRDEIKEKWETHKELIKHTRYIWLKNQWNMTEKQKSKLGYLEKMKLKRKLPAASGRGIWCQSKHLFYIKQFELLHLSLCFFLIQTLIADIFFYYFLGCRFSYCSYVFALAPKLAAP